MAAVLKEFDPSLRAERSNPDTENEFKKAMAEFAEYLDSFKVENPALAAEFERILATAFADEIAKASSNAANGAKGAGDDDDDYVPLTQEEAEAIAEEILAKRGEALHG